MDTPLIPATGAPLPRAKRTRRIVVGIDFSEGSNAAFFTALDHWSNDEVHGVFVDTPSARPGEGDGLPHNWLLLTEHLGSLVEAYGNAVGSVPTGVRHEVLYGDPATELVQYAAALDADLLVVGSHGRGGPREGMVGSVCERVLQLSGCPVLGVRPRAHGRVLLRPPTSPTVVGP